jgi:uncharacterized protein YjbK
VGVRETEFKYSLEHGEYDAVRVRLGEPQFERHFANRYFGVEGGTERKDWVLRLRVAENEKELTLKIGRELSPGVFDSQEYNSSVTADCPLAWEAEEPIRVLRREISRQPLICLGESINQRSVFQAPVQVGRLWELDRTQLPGGKTVYELEVEVAMKEDRLDAMRERLEGWLADAKVSIAPSSKTKYARFLAALQGR